jgi:hypothetical protein
VKKSLESRIRGWFPREPTLPWAATKRRYTVEPTNCNPTVHIPQSTYGVLKFKGAFVIAWSLLSLWAIFSDFANRLSFFFLITSIFVGFAVGSALGVLFATRLLRQLTIKHQVCTSIKEVLALVLSIAVLPIVGAIGLAIFLGNFTFSLVITIWNPILLSFGLALFIVDFILFLRYERKNDMIVLTGYGTAGYFEIPRKKPTTPVNLGNDWPVSEPANVCERNGLRA